MCKIFLFLAMTAVLSGSCRTFKKPEVYEVTIESHGSGLVVPDGVLEIIHGDSIALDIIPSDDFMIDRILLDGNTIETKKQLSIENVDSNHHVEVYFREIQTCLVLSVGGKQGLSHIGAIEAILQNEDIDCVFGNSMGSLIGVLFASEPEGSIETRYTELMNHYIEATEAEARIKGISGGVLGGVAAFILTGGASGLVTIAGTILGGLLNAQSANQIDNPRFTKILNSYLEEKSFSDLQMPFATQYIQQVGHGVEFITVSSGNLAEAVGHSINNPFIFKNADIQKFDPGADRISAIPILEAYRSFLPDRIVSVNVTGEKPIITKEIICEIFQIDIEPIEVSDDAFMGGNREFEGMIEYGYQKALSYY